MLLCCVLQKSSISLAIGIKSTQVLPHVGHDVNFIELLYKLQSFRISLATFISSIGLSDNDTLIVLPIPFRNIIPRPMLDFIVPLNFVPASVIPRCKG